MSKLYQPQGKKVTGNQDNSMSKRSRAGEGKMDQFKKKLRTG